MCFHFIITLGNTLNMQQCFPVREACKQQVEPVKLGPLNYRSIQQLYMHITPFNCIHIKLKYLSADNSILC